MFLCPVNPGLFQPSATHPVTRAGTPLTAAEIVTQKIDHEEQLRQYNECQTVETVLRHQIIDAIDNDYTQPLRNTMTDTINNTIEQIIAFLRDIYGQLSPSQLRERERAIDDMVYDPAHNINSVFNKIQFFQDSCTLIQNQKTGTQLITYAYLVLKKGQFHDKPKRVI